MLPIPRTHFLAELLDFFSFGGLHNLYTIYVIKELGLLIKITRESKSIH